MLTACGRMGRCGSVGWQEMLCYAGLGDVFG